MKYKKQEIITDNETFSNYSVSELSKLLNIKPSYISNVLKEKLIISEKQYIRFRELVNK